MERYPFLNSDISHWQLQLCSIDSVDIIYHTGFKSNSPAYRGDSDRPKVDERERLEEEKVKKEITNKQANNRKEMMRRIKNKRETKKWVSSTLFKSKGKKKNHRAECLLFSRHLIVAAKKLSKIL